MAIYHLSIKPVSRAQGRSATAAAAYRSASTIHDTTTGQTFDYSRKRGVEHAEIVLPSAADATDAQWLKERERLWNAAEAAERRKDARVAREYEVALPHELTKAERIALVREFAQSVADRYGAAVDVAIHAPHREGDGRNHHAHVLTTTRVVAADGLGAKTPMELSDADRKARGLTSARKEVTAVRARWAELTNEHLARSGHASRVDHRSLKDQGIGREPTVHQGPAITAIERRGKQTEIGFRLEAEASGRLLRAAELGRLERESREIARELVTASTDLASALRARTVPSDTTTLTLADQQARGRDAWLARREEDAEATRRLTAARERAATREQPSGLIVPPDRGRARDEDLGR